MPRLRQIGRDAAHPFAQTVYKSLFGDRDPVVSPGTDTCTSGNWWTVFALVPDAFDHAVAGFQFYRGKRKLDPKYRELGQTRVGWARGSQFVYSQHCKASRSVGLPEEKIAAIPHWQAANCYTEIERALLAYTDAPLVAVDYNHDAHSSVYDATMTKVIGGTLVKVCAWYDNEWGFSNRMLDTTLAWSRAA